MSTDKDTEGECPSALSSTAIESIRSILSTPTDTDQLQVTPPKVKLSWLDSTSQDEDADVIEIVEDIPLPNRPVKTSWRQSRFRNDIDGKEALKESIESTTASKVQSIGNKPKSSNISLLSTSVAHATLERCLLGCNKGELKQQSTVSSDNGKTNINYSKQCKPGHVIDLLELRRLSSRGIPDEPPELRSRARAASAPATNTNPSPDNSDHGLRGSTSAGNIQSPVGNPHRSYRPLVWRVLLGYLPPETDLWNEVLTRDRQLYANFVHEMFSSTCPAPHEVYDEEALNRRRVEEEEHLKTRQFLKGQNVYRTDKVKDGKENGNNNGDDPETPKPDDIMGSGSDNSRALTPGLLSARMQQEWVRGDDDNVFQTPDGRRFSSGDDDGNNSLSRISPLCAMNTPRSRSRKPISVGTTISEEKSEMLNSKSSCGTDEPASIGSTQSVTQSKSNDEGEVKVTGMMNDLLIPDDMDDLEVRKEVSRSVSSTTSVNGKSGCSADKPSITLTPSQDLDDEENTLLLDEIRKDVIRTHPDLRFFLEPNEDLGQKRYAALERILYVWAQLNKGVKYVQGMNEIVGTLYFVLAHDSNEDWANEAEADTYFLFNAIMVEMRDVFVPDLDESDSGIHGRISNMITLLALHDPEVRCHLDSVGIDPSFYSVRWLTTLLSREFLLPDTIRLWDSMLASTHKDNFLRYVSVTMVMVMRNQILEGDFSACLRLLQAFPPTNLDRLLESSRALWIYESQITLACHKGGISLGHALRSIAPPPAIIMAYGLHGGIAPPIREQVREAGQRGLKAARGAANGASSASKSFFGNAIGYWRSASSASIKKKDNN